MRIDEVEVACAENFEQAGVFFIFVAPFALPFGGDIVAAKGRWDGVIGRAVNQPLARVRDREFHRIGFAVVLGYLCRRAVEKLDDRVVAEVKLISALQVNGSGERDDPSNARFVGGEAERELPTSGMAHHDNSL